MQLKYCENCVQMTNHEGYNCLKCKPVRMGLVIRTSEFGSQEDLASFLSGFDRWIRDYDVDYSAEIIKSYAD